jgi:hypothetical protein
VTPAAGIRATFDALEAIWRSGELARIRTLWLEDLAAPLYLAEERKGFITGWTELEQYFAATAASLKDIRTQYDIVSVQDAGDDACVAAFEMRWSVAYRSDGSRIAGEVRGLALLKCERGAWRFRAYVEAPLAPIVYLRELYELAARSRAD